MTAPEFQQAITRAQSIIHAHPAVVTSAPPFHDSQSGAIQISVTVAVNLPNKWWADGESPSGIRRHEMIRLDFPRDYPWQPPEVSLRTDFSRNAAHMQYWLTSDNRPVPCIVDGCLSEFFFQQGLRGVLNQTVVWLERAAEGILIDPVQGWEPTRRDGLNGSIVADGTILRKLAGHKIVGRRRCFRFQGYKYVQAINRQWQCGWVHDKEIRLGKRPTPGVLGASIAPEGNLLLGKSVALIVWSPTAISGRSTTCEIYMPETVSTLGDLKSRAEIFGCGDQLKNAFSLLAPWIEKLEQRESFSFAVFLCVRRPFDVIGTGSPIELCPYVVELGSNRQFPSDEEIPVRPVGHRESVTRSLLERMSGVEEIQAERSWVLLGAGSLGSKIGLHLARAGQAPSLIIDQNLISPHNMARHALIPPTDKELYGAKSDLLRDVIRSFSQNASSISDDIKTLVRNKKSVRKVWPKHSWAVVNTTASLSVREALSGMPTSALSIRVIEAELFSRGQVGLIATEGPARNPNIGDLHAEFYMLAVADESLQAKVFGLSGNQLQRAVIGEGCGSQTMLMSDGRLSIFAAGMSEYLLKRQCDGLPTDKGELIVGTLEPSELGVCWGRYGVPKLVTVPTDNGSGWQVRIHERAVKKIQEDVERWPQVETGGALVGRLSETNRTFNVVDVVVAPEDSVRSSGEFVLGTKGLITTLKKYTDLTEGALYCLGTWHSHLVSCGPSSLDKKTARAIAIARLAPSILLIHEPDGFRALLADGADS